MYPYGHGLSYTTFAYSNLKLSLDTVELPKDKLTVSINVQNTGTVEAKESVILYLNDEFGSVSRPVREVKGFKKITLAPNENKNVSFELNSDHFSFINQHNQRVVEEGRFNVYFNNFDGNSTFVVKLPKVISGSSLNVASSFNFILIFIICVIMF